MKSFNVKVGPLSSEEVGGLRELCSAYQLTPNDMFRYALAMLYKATVKEFENAKSNLDTIADGVRPDAEAPASDAVVASEGGDSTEPTA